MVIWLALMYWTYADARRRIADPMLIGCATAASLFPFVGTIVYMIVRPPEYLDDVRERELEMQAAEARLAESGYHLCPYCDLEVEKDFLRCPNCMRKLKDPCTDLRQARLIRTWKICPYCEAEIGAMPPATPRACTPPAGEHVRAAGGRARPAKPSGPAAPPDGSPDTTLERRPSPMERTLILVKPDAFARNLTGEIVARFERKGLRLAALKHMTMTRELAERHYAEHDGKPFFEELVAFITSGPLVAMVLEGEHAVKAARQVIGATNPLEATRGRSAATSRSRSARTWSTAPIRMSRPRARSALFFPELAETSGSVPVTGLILASRSPQRRAILEQLGIPFSVLVPGVPELRAGPPGEVAVENAYRKAAAVAGQAPAACVLGVDTVVALGSRVYGKPADEDEARTTLQALGGRAHAVIGGLCLAQAAKPGRRR